MAFCLYAVKETMDNLSPCPLCASVDVKIYIDDDDQRLDLSALGPSRIRVSHGRILRCQACRFGFRKIRLCEEKLSELYRDLNSEVYESEFQARSKTAVRHLGIVQRYLVPPGRLLDVGCALGLFLRYATDAGWETVGVEPSRAFYERAKEILAGQGELICATLEEACLPPSSFDVVTLWDVLEHVPNPVRFMQICGTLLKSGGHLFVNVPNLDSLQAYVFGARWPLFLAEHLNYFNRNSLRLCGERAQLTWLYFGQRPVSFSIGYVLYRLAQKRIPGASIGHSLIRRLGISDTLISLFLGETYAVWKR